jgi:hypothetical protein
MKYIITESTLEKIVTKYLDKMFPEQEMKKFVYVDIDPKTLEDFDDENQIIFYQGSDLYVENEESFRWYGCEYFLPYTPQRIGTNCPVVIVNTPFSERLKGLFGNDWVSPFATWFTKRYDLPVKRVMS